MKEETAHYFYRRQADYNLPEAEDYREYGFYVTRSIKGLFPLLSPYSHVHLRVSKGGRGYEGLTLFVSTDGENFYPYQAPIFDFLWGLGL